MKRFMWISYGTSAKISGNPVMKFAHTVNLGNPNIRAYFNDGIINFNDKKYACKGLCRLAMEIYV